MSDRNEPTKHVLDVKETKKLDLLIIFFSLKLMSLYYKKIFLIEKLIVFPLEASSTSCILFSFLVFKQKIIREQFFGNIFCLGWVVVRVRVVSICFCFFFIVETVSHFPPNRTKGFFHENHNQQFSSCGRSFVIEKLRFETKVIVAKEYVTKIVKKKEI